MEMRSGPKVSGRSRRVAAKQGWSLRGVPHFVFVGTITIRVLFNTCRMVWFLVGGGGEGGGSIGGTVPSPKLGKCIFSQLASHSV